jgi:hypothetical protein
MIHVVGVKSFESNTLTSMSRCISSVRSQTVTLYRPMCYPAANLSSVLSAHGDVTVLWEV